jgi:arsenate reductase
LAKSDLAKPAITIWHNPKCGTSRKVLAAIRARGLEPNVVEYLKDPPSSAEIRSALKEMGIGPRELLRRRGTPYDDLGLGKPKWTDADLIAAMAKHPLLIERPVVRTRKGTRLCRPPDLLDEIL